MPSFLDNLKKIKKKKLIKKIFIFLMGFHLILFILILIASLYLKKHNPKITSLMFYRAHFCNYKNKPLNFMPLKKVPIDIRKMVVATEDYKFRHHWGIDIEAITRAYIINKKVGYRMYGGSTITQQLSRTLFLFPKKLLLRKYLEVFIAIEIDFFLTKDRILELYLNYAEWGRGIYGIKNAAKKYYHKKPKKLTIDESTRLITILANPVDYSPFDFNKKKFLTYRYYIIKFRYYTYLKFHEKEFKQGRLIK